MGWRSPAIVEMPSQGALASSGTVTSDPARAMVRDSRANVVAQPDFPCVHHRTLRGHERGTRPARALE